MKMYRYIFIVITVIWIAAGMISAAHSSQPISVNPSKPAVNQPPARKKLSVGHRQIEKKKKYDLVITELKVEGGYLKATVKNEDKGRSPSAKVIFDVEATKRNHPGSHIRWGDSKSRIRPLNYRDDVEVKVPCNVCDSHYKLIRVNSCVNPDNKEDESDPDNNCMLKEY